MKIEERDLIRSAYINNNKRNPYLKKMWGKNWIALRAKEYGVSDFEAWIKPIIYLQRFAWRFHEKGCRNERCQGCDDGEISVKELELRCYFHKKQGEFVCAPNPEAWMITGRRFGKTEALIFYVICEVLGYNPLSNIIYKTPRKWFIVGLSYPLLRDEVIPTFKRMMPSPDLMKIGDERAWDFKKSDLIAEIYNGSQVIFKSCEAGWKKFQSVSLHGIAFDEEPPEDIYKEAKLRIKGGETVLRIRGAMTPDPLKGLTWTYEKILKNERRKKIGHLAVWTGSSYENKAICRDYLIDYEKDLDEWEKRVRIHGEYVIGRGRCVFDVEKLLKMREITKDPIRVDRIMGAELKIWKEPEEGYNYVIGADPAEGLEHGDNTATVVINREKMEVVAEYVGRIEPDIYGEELIDLAKYYNNAWIVCEANNHGLTAIKIMMREGYPYIYSGKSKEEFRGKFDTRRIGWFTNVVTRPLLVDELKRQVREETIKIYSKDILDEMGTFVLNAKGKAEGQSGCKDDRVMALGLALQGHLRCPMLNRKVEEKPIIVNRRQGITWFDEDYSHEDETAWMRA